jgi:hypothetical protein
MKKLIHILTVDSLKDLLRYKSFFLLIFLLLFADRVIHHVIDTSGGGFALPDGHRLGEAMADFVFVQLPGQIVSWLFSPKVAAVVVGLFLLKQVISLWPSSDMRRMHRLERGRFGLVEALAVLRWHQVAWDALAVATACLIAGAWTAAAYGLGHIVWHRTGSPSAVLLFAGLATLVLPLVMAGFSYSSKLAVLSGGSFGGRFALFLRLLTDWHLIWTSWLFFSARIVIEFVFVAAIPTGAILLIDNFALRMLVATISATPVYSYLKMASFKFFLEAYRPYALVRQEYRAYFDQMKPAPGKADYRRFPP